MTASKSRGVVLIVDDEPLIRLAATYMVSDAGYECIEARNADEALRILRGRDDIDFLFTDINMPGSMDGLELAHAVRDGWPPMKIALTSGHLMPSEVNMPSGGRFVSKPYLPSAVNRVLTELAT